MEFNLTLEQKELLEKEVVSKNTDIVQLLQKSKKINDKWEIHINPKIVSYIRDKCVDYQMIVGFDESYHLNEKGKLLDELIDLFYV